MREYLLQFMSEEAAMGVQFLLALLFVLILFGVFVWFLRLITGKRRRKPAQHQNRLAILDRTQIDETRSLLLVRRDDVEHLVMIGGPSDVVVEANIDPYDEDDEDDMSGEKPGHQIARRVIAQRPLRTMSLSGSAAKVADSIGLTATSRPEATLAPPPPHQPAAETERATGTVEPADIRPVSLTSERAPDERQESAPAKVALSAEQVKPIRAVEQNRQEQGRTPPVVPAAMPELRPQHRSETVRQDIEMQEEPAEDAPRHDLAADFENALWQEMQDDNNSDQRTPAVQRPPEPSFAQDTDRNPRQPERDDQEFEQRMARQAPSDRQNSSERHRDATDRGFAEAMSQEPETPQQPAYSQSQRDRDNLALEDAIAGMLNDEQPDIDASDSTENSVYKASESVPDGTERPVDKTHPGRVDDEMSRLLQELAVPSRA